jgi:hypothetical protein
MRYTPGTGFDPYQVDSLLDVRINQLIKLYLRHHGLVLAAKMNDVSSEWTTLVSTHASVAFLMLYVSKVEK